MVNKKSIVRNLVKAGISRNVLKCSSGKSESYLHKRLKFEICNFLWENNIDFITEAVFMDNSRADLLILDWGVVIEVLCSESLKDFKKKSYSVGSIPVKTSIHKQDLLNMLTELRDTGGNSWQYYRRTLLDQ